MAQTYSAVDTFTDVGPAYQEAFHKVPLQVRSLEWITAQLSKGARVLDAGCGTGIPACQTFADAGLDVLGVDITPVMIEAAQRQVPNARFEVADSRTWNPSPTDLPFDCVYSSFALIAGVSQSDIRAFFHRAFDWVKPGGLFVFGTVPMDGENVEVMWLGRKATVSSLSAENTEAAIKDAGFVVEKKETEPFLPKGAEAGVCRAEDAWEEEHLFVYARKAK
ncbi:hypothetical protein B0A55_05889 [Friedmanniomyces simplex]|uniref:Methyltransferase domain-containing protein n=1 Tax=Friedmanniomyces simplex TaxID=329884 RepID=A0A4V5NGJ4_9PEZI|nr:hypothetical protein B0A55_05889 [Friedmanniomyces simplex]